MMYDIGGEGAAKEKQTNYQEIKTALGLLKKC
jgi:hypothetical protein